MQLRIGFPMKSTIGGVEHILIGGKENRAIVFYKVFCIARSKSIVTELSGATIVATRQNAAARGCVIEAVGTKDALYISSYRVIHRLSLGVQPVWRK